MPLYEVNIVLHIPKNLINEVYDKLWVVDMDIQIRLEDFLESHEDTKEDNDFKAYAIKLTQDRKEFKRLTNNSLDLNMEYSWSKFTFHSSIDRDVLDTFVVKVLSEIPYEKIGYSKVHVTTSTREIVEV